MKKLNAALLSLMFTTLVLSSCVVSYTRAAAVEKIRPIRCTLPDAGNHPGNVFLRGQAVHVPLPAGIDGAIKWQVTDETGRKVVDGKMTGASPQRAALGKLSIGWYRIAWSNSADKQLAWTTAAVLAPLVAPTPQDSPICVDAAIAWLAKDDPVSQDQLCRLATLAGVNWIRDRLRWRDIQPTQDQLVRDTTYDHAADIEHRYGLNVLQVFHDTPVWAAAARRGTGHFPTDLRHVYRFARAMSERFHGDVQAWEPWNEANVATFGGHTIDEICSYQKAAYLGFKAGDPNVTVCWNATTGVPTERQTDGVLRNRAWSYFDTYNIHTYDWADEYQRLWKPARRAACGKPLWITESDRGIACEPASPTHELSERNQRLKAEYVTQSYVQSLCAGSSRHFHFILGQYGEGAIQFGLLRHDLTPRPGYVALAALGRLLAGARCLGRYQQPAAPALHVYALRARPDGKERDVLVAWVEKNVDWPTRGKTSMHWTIPSGVSVEQTFDYLGRECPLASENEIVLTSAPLFLVLPKGQCDALPLTRPEVLSRRVDVLSSVVLQCVMPRGSATDIKRVPWASEIEYQVSPGIQHSISLFVYNFGDHAIDGTVQVERLPKDCSMQPGQWHVKLRPMQRQELTANVTIAAKLDKNTDAAWFTLKGDFGARDQPVVSFRVTAIDDDRAAKSGIEGSL